MRGSFCHYCFHLIAFKSTEKMCENVDELLNPIFEEMSILEQRAVRVMDYTRKFTNLLHNYSEIIPRNWWEMSEGAQKNYRPQDEEEIVSEDYLVLGFETAVIPVRIKIGERFNQGAIVRIWGRSRGGRWYLLYKGSPKKYPEKPPIFSPKLRQVHDLIDTIRLEFNHSQHDYFYTFIDGVKLLGYNENIKLTKCYLDLSKKNLSLLGYGESNKIKKPKVLIVQEKENYFNRLPDEMFNKIFQYLDLQSIARCACVCKKWNNLSRDSSFYQNLSLKKYWFKINNETLRYFEYRCTNLKKLDLSGCGNDGAITENIFTDFMKKCCKHLTHLSLCKCHFVGGETIEVISNCSELIDLRLRNCFKADNFSFLSKLTKLQTLDLWRARISNDELSPILKANENLKHLNLDDCKELRMDFITKILPIYNAKLITFSCFLTNLTDEGLIHLSKCAQLKELNVERCNHLHYGSSDCLEKLGQGCTDLRRLSLACSYELNDNLLVPMIRTCKQLTHLDLAGIRHITADICENALASLPKLNLLDVSCYNVQKEKIEYLRNIYPGVIIKRNLVIYETYI